MSDYILLLHHKPAGFADYSPEDDQKIVAKYVAWREKLASEGKLSGGHKLHDEGGKWMTGRKGAVQVTDGPYAEAKEVLGGLFIIKADNYEQAVAISKECPHLEYGRIELRAVDH